MSANLVELPRGSASLGEIDLRVVGADEIAENLLQTEKFFVCLLDQVVLLLLCWILDEITRHIEPESRAIRD